MLLARSNAIPAHCAIDLFGFESVWVELYRVAGSRQVWCGVNDINPRNIIPGADLIILRFDSLYVATSVTEFLAATNAELTTLVNDWRQARRVCEAQVFPPELAD